MLGHTGMPQETGRGSPQKILQIFAAQAAMLAVVILSVRPSVSPSVCPSVTRALRIFWYHTKGQSL